jgi:hypothetical protein
LHPPTIAVAAYSRPRSNIGRSVVGIVWLNAIAVEGLLP